MVDSSGQLGFQSSSARFKRDIHDMGDASASLMKLRPVSFRYKQDPNGSIQYGLIAEEVQQLYPELVSYGQNGKADGVRYDLLPAMLINEMQKQAADVKALRAQVTQKDAETAALRQQLATLTKRDAQLDALVERVNSLELQVKAARPERFADAGASRETP